MADSTLPDQESDDWSFSKPFIVCLVIGTILEMAGILLWQFDENYYFASIVLLVAGMSVEVYGFLIKRRENKVQ